MASLITLPQELLEHIIEYISSQMVPAADLLRLCLTCRTLRKLIQPLIYRNIHLQWTPSVRKPRVPQVLQFFNTFFKQPKLASLVRSLRVRNCHKRMLSPRVDKKLLSYLEKRVDAMRLPDPDEWKSAVKKGCVEAWIAIFMSELENLESLDIAFYNRHQSFFVSKLFYHSSNPRGKSKMTNFPKLRKINVVPDEAQPYHCEIPFQHITSLFSVPNLTALQFTSLSRPMVGDTIHQPPSHTSPVQRLTLKGCRVLDIEFAPLLRYTKTLHTLQYEADCVQYHYFSDQRFLSGLQPCAQTLTTLQLSIIFYSSDRNGSSWGLTDMLGTPRFYAGFPELRNLEVPIAVFLGWRASDQTTPRLVDAVPPTVENLLLSDDTGWFDWYQWSIRRFLATVRNYLMDVGRNRDVYGKADASSVRLRRLFVKIVYSRCHTYYQRGPQGGTPPNLEKRWADDRREIVKAGAGVGVEVKFFYQGGRTSRFIDLEADEVVER